jgi:uncharacterized protein YecT (DUF1311 family)
MEDKQMKNIKKPLFAFLLLSSSYLFAIDCNNTYSTVEMNECASQDYEYVDKQLNLVYKRLMSKLDSVGKEKLKTAQLAWLKFRDTQAELDADLFRDGTGSTILFLSSKTSSTQKRVEELQAYLKSIN